MIARRMTNGAVDVWVFACAQDPGEHARALSDRERAIAARFVSARHRDAYVLQHAMLRALLARYVDHVDFTFGPRGKPHVAGIQFNLAHCDDVALLAISREHELGVDIERIDADLDTRVLGRVVLARDEHFIAGDRRGFLRVWCRKEACLKATGIGLVDDLTAISVAADRVDLAGEIVHVQDLLIDADHAAALATRVPVSAHWQSGSAESI